ncbi:MAG TPA: DUF2232 domain-containing protein [bacterium]
MRLSREAADLLPACALSGLLFAAGVFVPLLGQPLGFVSGAPLVWLAARHGLRVGLLGSVLAAAALLPVLPPPVTLLFALEHALPAAFLGTALARGRGVAVPAAVAAVAITALVLGAAFLFSPEFARNPGAILEEQLRAAFTEIGDAAGEGAAGAAALKQLEEVLAVMRRVLPAVALIAIYIECSVNALLAARFLARRGAAVPQPDLTAFALPEALVWLLIPVLALALVPSRPVATVALNVLLPLLFAYLLQGLSIVLFFVSRAGLSRLGRTMLAVAFAAYPPLLLGPLVIGVLDFKFTLRTRFPLPPRTG